MMGMTLSPAERLLLLNQYLIMQHLELGDPLELQRNIAIVFGGWQHFYFELGNLGPQRPSHAMEAVIEILSFFRRMDLVITGLTAEGIQVDDADLRFVGFCSDTEPELLAAASFLLSPEMGRFQESAGAQNAWLPSAQPMMGIYELQREKYRSMSSPVQLTTAQLDEIAMVRRQALATPTLP